MLVGEAIGLDLLVHQHRCFDVGLSGVSAITRILGMVSCSILSVGSWSGSRRGRRELLQVQSFYIESAPGATGGVRLAGQQLELAQHRAFTRRQLAR